MKRTLFFVVALFLVSGLAWAGGESSGGAPVPTAEPLFAEGGGCTLPDLSGLSAEERMSAALAAGFQVSPTPAAIQACPVTFHCNSITNCAAGPVCGLADIGQCCNSGGGVILCCTSGTIKVQRCPCQCNGNPCAIQCVNSTDIRWGCS